MSFFCSSSRQRASSSSRCELFSCRRQIRINLSCRVLASQLQLWTPLKPVFPLFYWQKSQDFSRTFQDPHEKISRTFSEPANVYYKEKTAFTYNIQSVVHCRKFSMKQNVDVSCSEFRWTYLHMVSIYTQWLLKQFRSFSRTFQDLKL